MVFSRPEGIRRVIIIKDGMRIELEDEIGAIDCQVQLESVSCTLQGYALNKRMTETLTKELNAVRDHIKNTLTPRLTLRISCCSIGLFPGSKNWKAAGRIPAMTLMVSNEELSCVAPEVTLG